MNHINPEAIMLEYLNNPNRVSVLADRVLMRPAVQELARVGLEVDFKLTSTFALRYHSDAIQRDGLGVLTVIGEAHSHDHDRTKETRHVPFILSQMGLTETPTVHIPLSLGQVAVTTREGESQHDYTKVLELTDDIRFNPRRILEEGALLVRSLAELQDAVI